MVGNSLDPPKTPIPISLKVIFYNSLSSDYIDCLHKSRDIDCSQKFNTDEDLKKIVTVLHVRSEGFSEKNDELRWFSIWSFHTSLTTIIFDDNKTVNITCIFKNHSKQLISDS